LFIGEVIIYFAFVFEKIDALNFNSEVKKQKRASFVNREEIV